MLRPDALALTALLALLTAVGPMSVDLLSPVAAGDRPVPGSLALVMALAKRAVRAP